MIKKSDDVETNYDRIEMLLDDVFGVAEPQPVWDKDGNEYANADDYITFTISKTNGTVLANSDKDTLKNT